MTTNTPSLPANLPVPEDDGAYAHLTGLQLPSLPIRSTSNEIINLAKLEGLQLLFTYPRTAAPNEAIPDEWNAIPGARGCSPQACSFRDEMSELKGLGVKSVFGLSTQDTAYQQEAKSRLQLSYDLLSDEDLECYGFETAYVRMAGEDVGETDCHGHSERAHRQGVLSCFPAGC